MVNAGTLRKLGRDLLPPIVSRSLAPLWPSTEQPTLEYFPGGWAAAGSIELQGWDNEIIVEAERAKWNAFLENLREPAPVGFSHEHADPSVVRNVSFHNIHLTYAYVLARAARHTEELSVLDWGGGLGHYYALGKAMMPDLTLRFDCRDVPLICEAGRELCPEVRFYDDDSCLSKLYDIVMVNGSLGYFPEWKELLVKLAKTAIRYFFLTRVLMVTKAPSFVVLQHTTAYNYNSNMLTQVFNETELMDVMAKTGLRLVREFVVGDGPTISGAPEQCRDCGWLFERS